MFINFKAVNINLNIPPIVEIMPPPFSDVSFEPENLIISLICTPSVLIPSLVNDSGSGIGGNLNFKR